MTREVTEKIERVRTMLEKEKLAGVLLTFSGSQAAGTDSWIKGQETLQ